ncbi:rho GTPase-activating protein gacV-like [Pocillopora verrucosa]|uniref:rho GTPase-activating protein gacV-like n=1 Tax=Pocillopora verrucosa TaxID=203993 RepID=UPI0033411701
MASWTGISVVVIFALVDLSTAKPYGTTNEQVDNENHNEYQMMNDQGRPDQKLREFERDQGQLYHELSQLELQLDSLTRQQNDHNQPAYSAWQDDPKEEEQQQDEEELGDPEMENEADDSEMEEIANYIGLEEPEDEGSGEEEEIEESESNLTLVSISILISTAMILF